MSSDGRHATEAGCAWPNRHDQDELERSARELHYRVYFFGVLNSEMSAEATRARRDVPVPGSAVGCLMPEVVAELVTELAADVHSTYFPVAYEYGAYGERGWLTFNTLPEAEYAYGEILRRVRAATSCCADGVPGADLYRCFDLMLLEVRGAARVMPARKSQRRRVKAECVLDWWDRPEGDAFDGLDVGRDVTNADGEDGYVM
jgi:hypothetical protein